VDWAIKVKFGALTTSALLGLCEPAHSHGIAGNRYFDGTLTFDDPAVADEAILPCYTYLEQPAQGTNAIENRINWSFARLLTPLSSETKCNTPADLIIGTADQDLRECCHAMLFAFVG
jgi:hypothetical protein